MRVSKEVRIGILVSAALVIFFVGFYFLKGANLFSNDKEFNAFYTNVEGMQNSANVQISGLTIGRVSHMELVPGKGVKVTISVNKSISVPQGTVASIGSSDLLGGKVINLNPGAGPGEVEDGGTLLSAKEGGVIDKVSGELTPRLAELKGTIISLDTALAGVNELLNAENQKTITEAIRSVKATADNLARMSGALSQESGEMSNIIHNANSITGNLAKSNDTIRQILTNVNSITRQLSQAPIQKTLADLQKTSAQLQGIMDKINNGQGSLGLLINNKDMYNNLNSSIKSINNLTDDLKAHPGRYVNISVFGGGKKK